METFDLDVVTGPTQKNNKLQVISNEKLAKSRWHQLISRAKREQRYGQLKDYFNELIRDQIIEPVASSADTEQRVYLPNHYIFKESSLTTKMRTDEIETCAFIMAGYQAMLAC